MTSRQIDVQRVGLISSKPFESVVGAIEAAVGRPDMREFSRQMANAETFAGIVDAVQSAVGSAGLMEFARFDLGAVLRKESGHAVPKILRLVIGNPLVMKEMVKHVADAGSYAPVTILIDERADGVHLSYDRMAGFLAPYGSPEALQVARDLDAKVENLLVEAAS
jgi:uncharacterized protein (DUF302 family)